MFSRERAVRSEAQVKPLEKPETPFKRGVKTGPRLTGKDKQSKRQPTMSKSKKERGTTLRWSKVGGEEGIENKSAAPSRD